MNHRVETGDSKQFVNAVGVEQVKLNEDWTLSTQFLYTPQRFGRRVRQVVQHNNLVSGFQKAEYCVRSYVAGAAGDQNFHAL